MSQTDHTEPELSLFAPNLLGAEEITPASAKTPKPAKAPKAPKGEKTPKPEKAPKAEKPPKAEKAPKPEKAPKAAASKKGKSLEPQPDPRAPLDPAAFLTAARPVLRLLETDLLERSRKSPGVQRSLSARHAEERAAHRTADAFPEWERQLVGQIAAAWVLSVVFVRILEDRGLLNRARIAGPGAEDAEATFYALGPSLTPRDYLRTVFRELTQLSAGRDLFDARHNPVWLLGPSAEASRALLDLFRSPAADTPAFRFGQADTRFLGDLYQDLSDDVRERFALLQTPHFVERYILDHTLEPAITRFGLEGTTLIDPTCGSGHFLLGAFDRLLDHWERQHPGEERRAAIAAALDRVYGSDLNPYAVAIARFRLTLAVIEKGGYQRFHDVPHLKLHLAVADSLLHDATQRSLGDLFGQKAEDWGGRLFRLEDDEAAKDVIGKRHTVVVGNPPYITVKDSELRDTYRKAYPDSAGGKYSLAAPFAERFFQLARSQGYVGMITANSFMKREFGKGLITKCLPRWNLTGIINTAGAYIPGHGTPTVILFGTNEPPQSDTVWAILGKRGEPSTPDDPEQGLVWRSIVDHGQEPKFENDYVSVAQIQRTTLSKHPWSLGGGGAAELKELLEERAERTLGQVADEIGFASFSGLDDVFILPRSVAATKQLEREAIRPLITGESVRDWSLDLGTIAIAPYDHSSHEPLAYEGDAHWGRFLWPYRSTAEGVVSFGSKTRKQSGENWWEWYRWQRERYLAPFRITFAEVATHNHFVLDRGGKVFKQTAPIIKLPPEATEDDHYALLAYLNSSTACFWMKQVAVNKSNHDDDRPEAGRPEDARFAFAGTALSQIPIPTFGSHRERMIELARRAESLAQRLHGDLSGSGAVEAAVNDHGRSPRETIALVARQRGEADIELRATQQQLDELIYEVCGLPVKESLAGAPLDPSLPREAINSLEGPVHKRNWKGKRGSFGHLSTTFEEDVTAAATALMFERVERLLAATGKIASLGQLTTDLLEDASINAIRECSGFPDLHELLAAAFAGDAATPFLAAHRYTEAGLEKRAAWERTWDLQRREDRGENVGEIPVPPKYDPKDFKDPSYYRLRGKLDVPKERFISYPGCESDDDKSPLYGWAGWTHLQQAQALSALYMQRKQEGWSTPRLTPMLAGLLELLPWLQQWHNAPDESFNGLKLGDYFESFLEAETKSLDLKQEDLKSWRPTPGRGRKERV